MTDKQPSATVKFYDMPDGSVMTEVDIHSGYSGTNAQKTALSYKLNFNIKQESLGSEFAKVLHDNAWDLYET
jgi:hypothetical protein